MTIEGDAGKKVLEEVPVSVCAWGLRAVMK